MRIGALFVMLVLIATAYANICGGNCPAGNCPTCPCGYTTLRIDLDTYCTQYSWNQNCCRCIAQRISGGSQNFFKYENSLFSGGIIAVGQIEAINLCGYRPWSLVCYSYKDNAKCAERIYLRDGSWKYWQNDALACGCPITAEENKDNLSQITE